MPSIFQFSLRDGFLFLVIVGQGIIISTQAYQLHRCSNLAIPGRVEPGELVHPDGRRQPITARTNDADSDDPPPPPAPR